ncbi:hypothetical protein [Variovorax sp. UMC13]|uniref:hypothetical protein n=1 Tax=Variovorax sp. UMC13 TaxID=1862326 RepID=UPI001600F91B|nr:hypothetical protein [Variovorax sp. UMC13]MBB1599965.1 hypothetical protein [Variovorax sp. UMC13]
MEIVEVEILTTAITAQYGTLSQGTILRTSPAFAKHLVDEAGAAKYVKKDAKPAADAGAGGASAGGGAAAKPSDGLKVEELKAALEAKGIAIPEGVTKKAGLAALLDGTGAGE